MHQHELTLAQLRAHYDRQTAAWNALRDRFAALPQDRLRIANELLEQLNVSASVAPTPGPMAGVRA